MSAKPQN